MVGVLSWAHWAGSAILIDSGGTGDLWVIPGAPTLLLQNKNAVGVALGREERWSHDERLVSVLPTATLTTSLAAMGGQEAHGEHDGLPGM